MHQSIDPRQDDPIRVAPQPALVSGRRLLVNTGALTGANLWRIFASFVLQILVARSLGMEALGSYTIVLAYLNVCQVLSELGLPLLMVRDLAQTPNQRWAYIRAALLLQLAASMLVWGGLALWAALFPFSTTLQSSLWLIGASLPFYAVTSVTQTIFQSAERMDLVMWVELVINTLIVVMSSIVLWTDGDVVALVGVLVVTQLISAVAGLWLLARHKLLGAPQRTEINILAHFRTNSTIFFGLSLMDVLLQRADILLLSIFAGETITGLYSAAYAMVRVLGKLIQSGWRAIYPTLSRLWGEDRSRYTLLAGLGLRYGVLGVWLLVILGAGMAGTVVEMLFPQDGSSLVWVYQILLLSTPLLLCETYANTLLLIEQRARQSLLATSLHIATWVFLLPWMIGEWHAAGAAWATVLSASVGAGVALYCLGGTPVAPRAMQVLWLLGGGVLATGLAIGPPWPDGVRLAAALGGYAGLIWCSRMVTTSDIRRLQKVISDFSP